jgi:hypothetical protein
MGNYIISKFYKPVYHKILMLGLSGGGKTTLITYLNPKV